MTRQTDHRGFTLLEMIAATAMVAVLSASLYASLRIAFKARDSATRSVETVRKLNQAMEFIKTDLQSARIPSGTLAYEFTGEPAGTLVAYQGPALAFYAAAADIEPGPGIGDVKRIEYSCEPSSDPNDSGDLVLIRRVTGNLLATTTPEPKQEVLLRGMGSFTIRYFDGQTWQDSWESATLGNILPVAVDVDIELKGAEADPELRTARIFPIPCGLNLTLSSPTGQVQ